jgi:hypothetical protein
MKFMLFSAMLLHGTVGDPVAISQSWQEFPSEAACAVARNTIVTGDRVTDQGNKRIGITLINDKTRQELRREGTCIPAE